MSFCMGVLIRVLMLVSGWFLTEGHVAEAEMTAKMHAP